MIEVEAVPAALGAGSKIGIALSGGGSRAIAFHLGCLRTLHDLGLLQRASVLSTVSGGSVIGAMYATHEGTFDSFEERVRDVLRIGFVRPALRTVATSSEGLKASVSFFLLLHAAWGWSVPVRCVTWLVSRMIRDQGGAHAGGARERWLPRSFASRTTILRRTFDTLLFKGRTLGTLPTDRPRLVVIATELRTSSAFYFGKQDAGSYRIGKLDPCKVTVAQAVAASAAYPAALPALDETYMFRKRDGSLGTERVTLTDGGVYDNLGLAPLWPDRDRNISVGVEKVDVIVACRAGYGARMGNPSLFAAARLKAAFGAVHARAQNATMTRLFDLKHAGKLAGFALPYLDQDDDKLAFSPPDLVTRIAVADYPTNFSAMSAEWIDKLSKRGEQLTLAVIREHVPELLPAGWDRDLKQSPEAHHAALSPAA